MSTQDNLQDIGFSFLNSRNFEIKGFFLIFVKINSNQTQRKIS